MRLPRRQFVVPFLCMAFRRISSAAEPLLREFDFSSLDGLLVPNDRFFIRNHFSAPRHRVNDWTLRIKGSVRSPLEFRYSDLMRLSPESRVVTLECAGNRPGGGGVGTASWTGIPLKRVLELAGLRAGVKHIRLTGADSGREESGASTIAYARSIPVDKALDGATLLAFRMNDADLPLDHGYPLRAIVPGWYAMDSVKWLVSIEALDYTDTSFFMTQRYHGAKLRAVSAERFPVREMRVKSQISRPREGEALIPGRYVIRGAAWSGESQVARVEVSIDGGQQWSAASLEKHRHPHAWTLWNLPFEVATGKDLTVSVRAFDNKGRVQPTTREAGRVDGYELNWLHSVRCKLKATTKWINNCAMFSCRIVSTGVQNTWIILAQIRSYITHTSY